ncbi:MAG: preprotein translocase subunit SecE [Enterobacterales bacterium]
MCLIYITTIGKLIAIFLNEAKLELLNVIWPTKEETLNITLIVILVVIVMSTIIWIIDNILIHIISFLISLRLS